jgi:hypothetical protein
MPVLLLVDTFRHQGDRWFPWWRPWRRILFHLPNRSPLVGPGNAPVGYYVYTAGYPFGRAVREYFRRIFDHD